MTWLVLAPLALAGAGATSRAVPASLHLLGGLGPVLEALVAARHGGLLGEWRAGVRHLAAGPSSWALAAGVPLALLGLGLAVVGWRAGGGIGAGGAGDPLWGVVVSITYGLLAGR